MKEPCAHVHIYVQKVCILLKNNYFCYEFKIQDMEALSVKEYRNNLAASFTRADNGEQVLIRRKNEIYALVKVGREDLMITPELQAHINEVEKACKEGKCATCNTTEELDNYLNSL